MISYKKIQSTHVFFLNILNKIRDVVGNFSILVEAISEAKVAPPIALPFPCCSWVVAGFGRPSRAVVPWVRRFWKTANFRCEKQLSSTRWFFPSRDRTSSPNLGGHDSPLKRVTWTHHPKKVTAWITRHGWSLACDTQQISHKTPQG